MKGTGLRQPGRIYVPLQHPLVTVLQWNTVTFQHYLVQDNGELKFQNQWGFKIHLWRTKPKTVQYLGSGSSSLSELGFVVSISSRHSPLPDTPLQILPQQSLWLWIRKNERNKSTSKRVIRAQERHPGDTCFLFPSATSQQFASYHEAYATVLAKGHLYHYITQGNSKMVFNCLNHSFWTLRSVRTIRNRRRENGWK